MKGKPDKSTCEYIMKIIQRALYDLKRDPFNQVNLKGVNTNTINLDEGALTVLIAYYKKCSQK